jgi:outer membrane receptor protein involved in Fe transport
MKKTHIISLLLIIIFQNNIFSQNKITGKVVDNDNNPIEFIEVQLKNKDSIILKSELTNAEGEFLLETDKGKYVLLFRQIGEVYYKQNIILNQDIDIGTVNVILKTKQLEEIIVVSKKKLIERKVDRIIFNVDQSIVSQGVDAIEVLQRTPKVDVSKGSIQLVGKSNLGVMINGRLLNLSGSEIESYLRTIRSENISKIEVITTPPSKYDAQGNSGLINIILKKNTNEGWKGNISSTYIQRTYAGFIPSTSIFYNSEKVSLSFNLSADTEAKKPTSNTNIEFDEKYRNANESRKESSKGLTAGLNLNYSINKNNDLGFIYSSNFWDTRQNGKSENKFYTKFSNELDSIQYTPFYNKNKYNYHSFSSYYDLKIDTLGKKMNVNFNLLTKDNRNKRDFSTSSYIGNYENLNTYNSAINNSISKFNVYSLNIDFTLPYKFANIETGSKITLIENNSEIAFFNNTIGNGFFDTTKSNEFNYKEKVVAFYVSANKEIGEKWTSQIGLRYENTETRGNSITLNTIQNNLFSNLFPSAYLTYDPNENNSFGVSYSKRIERPGFSEVNPFRVYSDFYSYESGNPQLLPVLTDNVELSYVFKNNLSLTLYGSKLNQGKDYITLTNINNNSVISTPQNYYNQNTLGFDVSYTYEPLKWLNSFNSYSAYYNDSKSYIQNITIPNFKGYGSYFSSKNSITLNTNKTTFVLLNFFQSFPNTEGFLKSYNRASFDLGFKFMQFNKNLQVSIVAYDMFRQNRNRGIETYPNYKYSTNIYNDIRNITLSLNYKFGNNKVKTINKKIENTEKQRL